LLAGEIGLTLLALIQDFIQQMILQMIVKTCQQRILNIQGICNNYTHALLSVPFIHYYGTVAGRKKATLPVINTSANHLSWLGQGLGERKSRCGPGGLGESFPCGAQHQIRGAVYDCFLDFCHKLCSLGMGHVQPLVTAGICAASNAAGLQSLVTPSWIEGFL
jgi:hypothetical protein